MLQCVAVGCSVLQCIAVCCSVLLCVLQIFTHMSHMCDWCMNVCMLLVCCSVLQCIAVCCSVLQGVVSAIMYVPEVDLMHIHLNRIVNCVGRVAHVLTGVQIFFSSLV